MNQPKDLPQLPPCFTWSNEHACRFWNEEGMYEYARAALAAATPSAPAVAPDALTDTWLESARFDASEAIDDRDGELTGCLDWCRAFAEIVLRHSTALSGKSEAAAGEPVADLIFDLARTDARNERIELGNRIVALLDTAPPAASGQKLTDELIGIAAKYIQTGYLHDFTNEVRALLRASDSATASDKDES